MKMLFDNDLMTKTLNSIKKEGEILKAPILGTIKTPQTLSIRKGFIAHTSTEVVIVKMDTWNIEKIENIIRIPLKEIRRVEISQKKALGIQEVIVMILLEIGRGYRLGITRNVKGFENQSKNIDEFLQRLTPYLYN